MRDLFRTLTRPNDRLAMVADALGVLSIFAIAYAALHLPLFA